ncbi:MAG: FISUMP domain-containing protein [Bacteroidales bacterium]|nr:FISUMP domain-containing protein [Bacteroidales bacterium]MDY6426866.1 FISUMP domain-containing protein [Bacteroidales bacterium]
MKTKTLIMMAAVIATVASGCKKESEPSSSSKTFPGNFNGYVTDCQGHTYPVVKIGDQYWMAENLQCTQYDTESERPGVELTTPTSPAYDPYYIDGRNYQSSYTGSLSDEQRKHLGLLYNWAAAVGFASEAEAKAQTSEFSGNRQGICPNGWHIPTATEWDILRNFIEGFEGKGENTAGKYLKTTSGWYFDGNGVDEYGFAALPAGDSFGTQIADVGQYTYYYTATPNGVDEYSVYYYGIIHYKDYLHKNYDEKNNAKSVRCVKN